MTAIKGTIGLAKAINDAKTDAEVKAATLELVDRLMTLQLDCLSLVEVIQLRDEKITLLSAKIAEFEDFKTQTEGYVLEALDSGSFVYSKIELVGGSEKSVKLCPHCFSKNIKSILHGIPVGSSVVFHKTRCLNCENEFLMNKNPQYEETSIKKVGSLLSGY
ncbi:Uncharacterised protein [Serratia quinivorans]|uniref:Uncharacterized protein n=2 Tax=Serratia TaxID=613 RepID=A0A380AIZ0_9GAMM|nr:Uncharacterised protein [Serratia quinivorans]